MLPAGQPEGAERPHRRSGRCPGHLDDGERQATRHLPDVVERRRRDVGGVHSDEVVGALPVKWSQRDVDGEIPAKQAALDLLNPTSTLAVADDDEGTFPVDAPGEIVQQPQAGLVRLVHVVHGQQQTGARRCEPEQLGSRNEQPLVGSLTAPRQLSARQSTFDLPPVRVAQPVEQRRMPSAQVGELEG